MRYKELAELFRRNRIPDELIALTDDFLEQNKETSFSVLDLQCFLNATKELTDELISELIDIGVVEYVSQIDCPRCGTILELNQHKAHADLTCNYCGSLVDTSKRDLPKFITKALNRQDVYMSLEFELFQKRQLEHYLQVYNSQRWLAFLRFDLCGITILQHDHPEKAIEVLREFADSFFPRVFSLFSNFGLFVKQEGDAFVYIFKSASEAFKFAVRVFHEYSTLEEEDILRSCRIKAFLTLIENDLRLYLALNDSFDVLGYDVSKSYRFEKNADLPKDYKNGVIALTKEVIDRIDLKNADLGKYIQKRASWPEKGEFVVSVDYIVIPY